MIPSLEFPIGNPFLINIKFLQKNRKVRLNPGRHETKYCCCWYIWRMTESKTKLLCNLTSKINFNSTLMNSIMYFFFVRSIHCNSYNEPTGRKTGKFQQCGTVSCTLIRRPEMGGHFCLHDPPARQGGAHAGTTRGCAAAFRHVGESELWLELQL